MHVPLTMSVVCDLLLVGWSQGGGGRIKKERENRVAMKMVREKMAATVRVITESILIGSIKTQSSVGIMLIETV